MGSLLLAFACALAVSAITAPVGVSGAVFLLPVQASVLGVPSPTVTPTNLLYNVVATPGALLRFARHGQVDSRLARALLAGAIPGVVLGAWLRSSVLPGDDVFRLMLALLMTPLGGWLLLGRTQSPPSDHQPASSALVAVALAVGLVGGLVGIGGGSLLAPILASVGMALSRVAPVALLVTFVTSFVGVATFAALAAFGHAAAAPDWSLGLALGVGGMLGGYIGARAQPRIRDVVLRRILGIVAVALGVAYAFAVI